ncbi:MAG: chromosomal replication initiator protein DnaA [Phycisphaeraceae bacterium]|nr:MAG: chromosomal replication initiator protein DnaA [Phycisphaeraceae bacterium]
MTDPDRVIWDGMLSHLRRHHPALCRHWFSDLEPVGIAEGSVHLRASSDVHRDYLRRECVDAFVDAAQTASNSLLAVRFLGPGDGGPVPARAPGRDASVESLPHAAAGSRGADSREHEMRGSAARGPQPMLRMPPPSPFVHRTVHVSSEAGSVGSEIVLLNPDYVFDNFIVGPGNRWAYAASVAVAESPGQSYNPLFIHGDVGLGKTHLLQAICLRIRERWPDRVMHYISCDGFINNFMQAVQNNETDEFRHRFREVDVLVIDDIHFLTKRERSQEEFFHTFNSLYQQKKQIILSSDAPPEQIPHLENRLVSRFRSGLVTEVEKPTFETRVAILFTKARLRGIELGRGVAEYIAGLFDTNIRELEGAITRLQIRATVEDRGIDLELAREALGDEPRAAAPQPTIEEIIKVVCAFYDVKRIDLLGKRRHKSISLPRQVCMSLARQHTRLSLEEIGAQFGGRDHTTVIHAVKSVKSKRKQDIGFQQTVERLETELLHGSPAN